VREVIGRWPVARDVRFSDGIAKRGIDILGIYPNLQILGLQVILFAVAVAKVLINRGKGVARFSTRDAPGAPR
jgi:hypothetical protein